MKAAPYRLTVVMTHPVQYYAPWFRQIHSECDELDLRVVYATEPNARQQGEGFGREFRWDTPLTSGYNCHVVRSARRHESVHSDRFWGLNVPEMGRVVCKTQPDVVLIPGWYSVTLARALRTCRRRNIPLLYRGDTNLHSAPQGWTRWFWQLKTRYLLRQYDAYLAVGQRSADLLRQFGVADEKIHHSPHCVDNLAFAEAALPCQADARGSIRAEFGLDAADFVALFVGKLEHKKRPLDAIRAIAKLGDQAKLLMVGQGPLEAECRQEAERSGAACVWTGFLNQSELGKAYAAADCLVLPSDGGETWGLVVNEAMATGLPCIVGDQVGCAPDLVSAGQTGDVFPTGDVEALTSAMNRLRHRVSSGHSFAEQCQERISKYTFQQATEGLLAAVRSVAGRSRRSTTQSRQPALPNPRPLANSEQSRVLALCGNMVIVAGLERQTFEVLRVLREHGAATHCVVNNWENHRIVELAEQSGTSWSEGDYSYYLTRRLSRPLTLARMLIGILSTSWRLQKDIRTFKPSHFLAPEFCSVLLNAPALAVSRWQGRRVILRLGNAPPRTRFYRFLYRWILNPLVDLFVCNSKFTRQALLESGVPEAKVRHIYNCVPHREPMETQSALPEDTSGSVIFVGQIIPPKGVHVLLDAIGLLVKEGFDPKLRVVGDLGGFEPEEYKGYHAQLLRRAQQDDLKGRVDFLGYREDILPLMRASEIHCCPSLPEQEEAFGVVNIEAKDAGVPTVATPFGAMPELIQHRTDGWITRDASPQAIAEGLKYFLANPQSRLQAGDTAKQSLSRFSRERFSIAWCREFGIDAEESSLEGVPKDLHISTKKAA